MASKIPVGFWIWITLLLCNVITFGKMTRALNVKQWLDEIENRTSYDKLIPPKSDAVVRIEMYIESMGNFQAKTMDYDIDLYFIEMWNDHRLKHNETMYVSLNDREQIQRFWLPDTFFANSKSASIIEVPIPNYVFKISANGDIRYSLRISLKLSCHTDLRAYPMDKQMCHVDIRSSTNLKWQLENAIILNPDIAESNLHIDRQRIEAVSCNGSRTYFKDKAAVGCLLAKFHLERYLGYSFVQTYAPSMIIVVISWISFWIDAQSIPGRVTLLISTLLAQSTRAVAGQFHLPAVAYAKAQDVWFGLCVLFQFAALIQFAVVNLYVRRSVKAANRGNLSDAKNSFLTKIFGDDDTQPKQPSGSREKASADRSRLSMRHMRTAIIIDIVSRVLFPAGFAVLCVVYWGYYLSYI